MNCHAMSLMDQVDIVNCGFKMMHADTCTAYVIHSLEELLYPQTNNESLLMNGLSTKSLNTIMIEPTVNDALTKFIALLTKMYTAN